MTYLDLVNEVLQRLRDPIGLSLIDAGANAADDGTVAL